MLNRQKKWGLVYPESGYCFVLNFQAVSVGVKDLEELNEQKE